MKKIIVAILLLFAIETKSVENNEEAKNIVKAALINIENISKGEIPLDSLQGRIKWSSWDEKSSVVVEFKYKKPSSYWFKYESSSFPSGITNILTDKHYEMLIHKTNLVLTKERDNKIPRITFFWAKREEEQPVINIGAGLFANEEIIQYDFKQFIEWLEQDKGKIQMQMQMSKDKEKGIMTIDIIPVKDSKDSLTVSFRFIIRDKSPFLPESIIIMTSPFKKIEGFKIAIENLVYDGQVNNEDFKFALQEKENMSSECSIIFQKITMLDWTSIVSTAEYIKKRLQQFAETWFDLFSLTPDRAINKLESKLAANPDDAVNLNNLGVVYLMKKNDIAKGKDYIEKAAKLAPDLSTPIFNLGAIYALENSDEQAIKKLQEVLLKIDEQSKGDKLVADQTMISLALDLSKSLKENTAEYIDFLEGRKLLKKNYAKKEGQNFTLRYDKIKDEIVTDKILKILEESYGMIGKTLAFSQIKKKEVFLASSEEEFTFLSGIELKLILISKIVGMDLSKSIFLNPKEELVIISPRVFNDIKPFEKTPEQLIISELSGNLIKKALGKQIPQWLEAGLIELFIEKQNSFFRKYILTNYTKYPSIKELEDFYLTYDYDMSQINIKAFFALKYIIKQIGSEGLNTILTEFKNAKTLEEAFSKGNIDYSSFDEKVNNAINTEKEHLNKSAMEKEAVDGITLYLKNNFPEAERKLTNAIELGLDNSVVHYVLSLVYFNNSKPISAIDELKRTISKEPTNGTYHVDLASLYLQRFSHDKAKEEIVKALKLGIEPREREAQAHTILGSILLNMDDKKDEAVKEFEKAVNLSAGSPVVVNSLLQDLSKIIDFSKDKAKIILQKIADTIKDEKKLNVVNIQSQVALVLALGKFYEPVDKNKAVVYYEKALKFLDKSTEWFPKDSATELLENTIKDRLTPLKVK